MPLISDAVDHINCVVKMVSVDHFGISSDHDGGGGQSNCVEVSDFPKVTKE